MKSLRLLAASLLLAFTACQKRDSNSAPQAVKTTLPSSEEIDPGTVQNSIYQNEYFAFHLTLPSDWSVQESAVRQRLAERGAQALAGDDPGLKSVVKASQAQTVTLFAVFKHPLGSPVPFNPNVSAVAENVGDFAGIKTGKDYLFHAKNLLAASPIKMQFSDEITSTNFGGVEFHGLQCSMKVGNLSIQQTYYSTIRKGYALNFILTYGNEEESDVLNKILGSLSFK